MLFWNVKILEEDAISEYQKSMVGTMLASGPDNFQFVREEVDFEEFKVIPGIAKDREEERILKTFLFEIFRDDYLDKLVVKDYIDTLRMFNQLQVFKYGDTLMILHEAGGKHFEPQA